MIVGSGSNINVGGVVKGLQLKNTKVKLQLYLSWFICKSLVSCEKAWDVDAHNSLLNHDDMELVTCTIFP